MLKPMPVRPASEPWAAGAAWEGGSRKPCAQRTTFLHLRDSCGVHSSLIRALFLGLVGMYLGKYLCVLKCTF